MFEHPGIPTPGDAKSSKQALEAIRSILEVWLGRSRQANTERAVTFGDLIGLGLVTQAQVDVYLGSEQETQRSRGRQANT